VGEERLSLSDGLDDVRELGGKAGKGETEGKIDGKEG
jgi:hypothetical protein